MANVNNRVPMGYVSEDFVKQRVMNRKQFYEGFIRNNYWTPKYEFCTRKWMLAVLEKEAYCPKHGIRAKQIVSTPSTKFLRVRTMSKLLLRAQDLLQRPMQRQQAMAFIKTARQIRRKNPGTQWMVGVIFDLDPQDEIFQKSFKAPSRERTQNPKFQAYFKDYDGFWEGLPVNDNLDQPGQKRSIGVPKNQRLKQKFQHILLQKQRILDTEQKIAALLRAEGEEVNAVVQRVNHPNESELDQELKYLDRMFKRIDPDGEPKKQVVDDSDDDDDDDLDNLDSYVNANSNANPPGDDDTVDSEFERNRMIQVYGGRSQQLQRTPMPLSKNEEMKNEQLLITMPSDFSMPAASKNKNSIPMRKDKDVTMLSDQPAITQFDKEVNNQSTRIKRGRDYVPPPTYDKDLTKPKGMSSIAQTVQNRHKKQQQQQEVQDDITIMS